MVGRSGVVGKFIVSAFFGKGVVEGPCYRAWRWGKKCDFGILGMNTGRGLMNDFLLAGMILILEPSKSRRVRLL